MEQTQADTPPNQDAENKAKPALGKYQQGELPIKIISYLLYAIIIVPIAALLLGLVGIILIFPLFVLYSEFVHSRFLPQQPKSKILTNYKVVTIIVILLLIVGVYLRITTKPIQTSLPSNINSTKLISNSSNAQVLDLTNNASKISFTNGSLIGRRVLIHGILTQFNLTGYRNISNSNTSFADQPWNLIQDNSGSVVVTLPQNGSYPLCYDYNVTGKVLPLYFCDCGNSSVQLASYYTFSEAACLQKDSLWGTNGCYTSNTYKGYVNATSVVNTENKSNYC